jgi:hypothetical protein
MLLIGDPSIAIILTIAVHYGYIALLTITTEGGGSSSVRFLLMLGEIKILEIMY